MQPRYHKIISSSQNTEYTGSLVKAHVLAGGTILNATLGYPDDGYYKLTLTGSQFDNSESMVGTFNTPITVTAGSNVDLPAGRVKVGTAGLLLYFSNGKVTEN